MARLRTHLAALAFGMSLALGGGPASALERFVLRLPFLETEITINFSLRSFRGEPSPAQVGPVILGWINEQLEVDGAVSFSGGGWGDERGSLVDVSARL